MFMNQDQIFAAIDNELRVLNRPKSWLCDRIGVSTQAFNNWQNRGIPQSRLAALAEVFDWSEVELRKGRVVSASDDLLLSLYQPSDFSPNSQSAPEQSIAIRQLKVSKHWVKHTLQCESVANLSLFHISNNSMAPTFATGDILIIDQGNTELKESGVFVLRIEERLMVKRLEIMLNGSVLVSSDNSEHKPYTIGRSELSSANIIGRAIWAVTGRSL